jgi:valyl-tRNA synthetase
MASLGGVLKLDMQRIAGYRNFGTKLWNACSFAQFNEAFEHRSCSLPSPDLALNKWIIGEVGRVRVAVDAALDGYRFNDAASALYGFVWGTLCDRYLELSKPIGNTNHTGLGLGAIYDPTASHHALYHRRALGHHRKAQPYVGASRLAGIWARIGRYSRQRGNQLGHFID